MKPQLTLDGITRTSGVRERKKKYLIISEGYVTEINYFTEVKRLMSSKSGSPLADIVPLKRYHLQSGESDPKRVVSLTEQYIQMLKTSSYTVELFVGKIIDSIFEKDELSESEMRNIGNCLKQYLNDHGLTKDGLVISYQDALADSRKLLKDEFNIDDFEMIDDEIDYDESTDIICIVVDRDKDCRNCEKYRTFIEECRKHGYRPYVTNPKFELWLLMHFDIERCSEQLRNHRTCIATIKKKSKEFGLIGKDIDCSEIVLRISDAIKLSSDYCNDVDSLEESIGTNISLLMKELGF